MGTDTATMQAQEAPQDAWMRWQREHADMLERATRSQQVLLEATVRFVAVIAAQPILLRAAAFFLLHAGIFHFETLDDPGFAILSGGKKVMSRSRLGGLVRAAKAHEAKKLVRATEPRRALRNQAATLSVDEHVIARFTRKFKIPKGFHTIRNKKMRAEKLFYLHWPKARRFLGLVVTPGNAKLVDRTIDFIRALRRRVQLRRLRIILDAGASLTNDGLRRLDRFRKTVFLIRAPRRRGYTNAWRRLPRERFTQHEEPGRYRGAKAKEIEVAETSTAIAGIAKPIRTIVVRERAMKGKDRCTRCSSCTTT